MNLIFESHFLLEAIKWYQTGLCPKIIAKILLEFP